jgi:hypothetical protein
MVTGDYSTPLYGSFDVSGQVGLYSIKRKWDDCYCYYLPASCLDGAFQLNPGTDEVEARSTTCAWDGLAICSGSAAD